MIPSNRAGRHSLAARALVIAIGAALAASSLASTAHARLWASGPRNRTTGFPTYYEDMTGLRLSMCVDLTGRCSSPKPSPGRARVPGNFPDEAFWWSAEALMSTRHQGRARLVMAVEAAFLNEVVRDGDQMSFGRVRVRADHLVRGRRYKVTYPYGVLRLRANRDGEINFTRDIGCGRRPCSFKRALRTTLGPRLLRWDPSRRPRAPRGYIGNPAILHRVVGSPRGTNVFRIRGPKVGGRHDNKIMTRKFALEGKLAEFRCTIRDKRPSRRIRGTNGNDVICAGRGRDIVNGRGGRDTLVGGAGRDRLIGGRGKDDLYGGGKPDELRGGKTLDLLRGGVGGDVLIGADGRDLLWGNGGRDRLRARRGGRDRLFGGPGRDSASLDRRDRFDSVELRAV